MVGVRKALQELVEREQPVDRDVVLGILVQQQEVYAAQGAFRKKELALAEIITGLQQGAIGAEAVVRAAGVDGKGKPADKGFSLRRLFGRG